MKLKKLAGIIIPILALVLVSACAGQKQAEESGKPASGSTPKTENVSKDGVLEVAGITFDIPEGWIQEEPESKMRLAQMSLPGNDGPALLTVFSFGQGKGGSIQANIDRWVNQFKKPDNPKSSPEVDINKTNKEDLTITIVKTTGTFSASTMGPMGGSEPQANQALFGLIVEGGGKGNVFIKVTGPEKTIEAQTPNLEAFASSVRK